MSGTDQRRVNALLQIGIGTWLVTQRYATSAGPGGAWSEQISGFLVLIFGIANLRSIRAWRDWAVGAVGIWLLFSPLLFWEKEAASYQIDSLAGILLVLFSVILPVRADDEGPTIPPGWSYNPASWSNRAPIILIGFAGFFIARHMAAYQLGHIERAWDPFFGRGTEIILESEVSRAFPVSDAGLGAATYLVESLSGLIGGERRWRTMPWMVLLFVVLVVPAGVVSVVLVVLQPLSVGTWCTLCLTTAFLTVVTVPPAIDEVIAMAQFLKRKKNEGHPLWRTFWRGERVEQRSSESRMPEKWLDMTITWNLALSAAAGAWFMAAPDLLTYAGFAAQHDRILGALVFTCAVIAMAEVARPVRFINVGLGVWAVGSAAFLDGSTPTGTISAIIAGVFISGLSLRRGPIREKHGAWDKLLQSA